MPAKFFLILAVGLAQPVGAMEAPALATFKGAPVLKNRVLMAFQDDVGPRREAGSRISAVSLVKALGLPDGCELRRNAFSRLLAERSGRVSGDFTGSDLADAFFEIELNDRIPLEAALKQLNAHPWVAYAEPDPVGQGGDITPTDPSYSQQWHHPKIGSPKAWEITQGDPSVTVAVLDTGLNAGLSEFFGRVVAGYDFVNDDSFPADDHGHGTAVAGALGANANNGSLVAGVDWNCRIMPVKVLNENNTGNYSTWASAIDFAVSSGADVINLSAGGLIGSTTLSNTILNAIDAGVIFVTITHNDSSSTIRFPGSMLEPITVGATDANDTKSSFSNTGMQIDLVAPGRDIYTVDSDGTIGVWWGTSFAAPLVSGVAALLKAVDPTIDHYTARALICAGTDDLPGGPPIFDIWDPSNGWGRLNAYNTLLLATEHAVVNREVSPARVEWNTPANAANLAPYRLFETADVNSPSWTEVSSPISYGASKAHVEVPVDEASHYYNLQVSMPPSGME